MKISDTYPFVFLQNKQDEQNIATTIKLYRFKSTKSNLSYIVRVEVYPQHIYAIKFYLKKHSNSPNKYRLMANTYEPRRIINTCINIMLSIYENDKLASFGFIGANGIGENTTYNTKRFRVYTTLIATYFTWENFVHKENKEKSTYLIVNRKSLDCNPNLVKDAEEFFTAQYDYFD